MNLVWLAGKSRLPQHDTETADTLDCSLKDWFWASCTDNVSSSVQWLTEVRKCQVYIILNYQINYSDVPPVRKVPVKTNKLSLKKKSF